MNAILMDVLSQDEIGSIGCFDFTKPISRLDLTELNYISKHINHEKMINISVSKTVDILLQRAENINLKVF